jgi:hypothetical protein
LSDFFAERAADIGGASSSVVYRPKIGGDGSGTVKDGENPQTFPVGESLRAALA